MAILHCSPQSQFENPSIEIGSLIILNLWKFASQITQHLYDLTPRLLQILALFLTFFGGGRKFTVRTVCCSVRYDLVSPSWIGVPNLSKNQNQISEWGFRGVKRRTKAGIVPQSFGLGPRRKEARVSGSMALLARLPGLPHQPSLLCGARMVGRLVSADVGFNRCFLFLFSQIFFKNYEHLFHFWYRVYKLKHKFWLLCTCLPLSLPISSFLSKTGLWFSEFRSLLCKWSCRCVFMEKGKKFFRKALCSEGAQSSEPPKLLRKLTPKLLWPRRLKIAITQFERALTDPLGKVVWLAPLGLIACI